MKVISSSSGSGTERMFKDIPNNSRWISRFFNNIFKQKQQIHMRINLVTTISLYPTQESWLIVKIMPQSAMKTTLEYELYAQASQESPSVGASVNKLKETTFAETKRLQLLQKQFIEGTLFPDGGIYDLL
jgi:hypothetical protein